MPAIVKKLKPAAVVSKQEKKPNWLQSSDEQSIKNIQIILHGQPGSGKTTTAVSASSYFPDKLPDKKCSKITHKLEDMLFLAYDKGATIGLKERGISVQQFDVRSFRGDERQWIREFDTRPTIFEASEFGLKVLMDEIRGNTKIQWVVVDTISALDRDLVTYYLENAPLSKKGEPDTRGAYGLVLCAHKLFHDAVLSLGCGIVYCCHSMTAGTELSPAQEAVKMTITMPGSPDILPAITGKGALAYKGDSTLELFIHAQPIPGGKGKLQRWAYPVLHPEHSAEAKNRMELSLEGKEEPHLGKIIKKLGF